MSHKAKETFRGIPQHKWLRSNGRIAGNGMAYDDYSEESGNKNYEKREKVRFPSDKVDPSSLNGECIIIQKGKTEDG